MSSERRSDGGGDARRDDVGALRRAAGDRDAFVAMVSHELRTPLTAIRGSLAILGSGVAGDLGDEARRLVDIAERNCGNLLRVIDDLLDVERVRAGKLRIEPERTALGGILDRALETCRALAGQHDVSVDLADRSGGAELHADAGRIAQAVTNLLSNAVKFSPPGGRVELVAERRGGHVRISVSDSGPGIPASFRDAVFEAFAQADSATARRKGGAGLGLAIARTIVEAHGGRIDYRSAEGAGTTFTIDLPLARTGPSAATAA